MSVSAKSIFIMCNVCVCVCVIIQRNSKATVQVIKRKLRSNYCLIFTHDGDIKTQLIISQYCTHAVRSKGSKVPPPHPHTRQQLSH